MTEPSDSNVMTDSSSPATRPAFDFATIPGCVFWLESDANGQPVSRLDGREVFVWEDPNQDDRGVILGFDRVLTDAERALVEAALAARYNPIRPPR